MHSHWSHLAAGPPSIADRTEVSQRQASPQSAISIAAATRNKRQAPDGRANLLIPLTYCLRTVMRSLRCLVFSMEGWARNTPAFSANTAPTRCIRGEGVAYAGTTIPNLRLPMRSFRSCMLFAIVCES